MSNPATLEADRLAAPFDAEALSRLAGNLRYTNEQATIEVTPLEELLNGQHAVEASTRNRPPRAPLTVASAVAIAIVLSAILVTVRRPAPALPPSLAGASSSRALDQLLLLQAEGAAALQQPSVRPEAIASGKAESRAEEGRARVGPALAKNQSIVTRSAPRMIVHAPLEQTMEGDRDVELAISAVSSPVAVGTVSNLEQRTPLISSTPSSSRERKPVVLGAAIVRSQIASTFLLGHVASRDRLVELPTSDDPDQGAQRLASALAHP